jgi:predicted TIM-barrel fold metal-dependent hydrolase
MTPRIDAHQHFWHLARGDYAWLTPALDAMIAHQRVFDRPYTEHLLT